MKMAIFVIFREKKYEKHLLFFFDGYKLLEIRIS